MKWGPITTSNNKVLETGEVSNCPYIIENIWGYLWMGRPVSLVLLAYRC